MYNACVHVRIIMHVQCTCTYNYAMYMYYKLLYNKVIYVYVGIAVETRLGLQDMLRCIVLYNVHVTHLVGLLHIIHVCST